MSNEEKEKPTDGLDILDDFSIAVETFTGLKNLFINAGWTDVHAEEMVIQMLTSANLDKMKGK